MKYGGRGGVRRRMPGGNTGGGAPRAAAGASRAAGNPAWEEVRTTGGRPPFAMTREEAVAKLAAEGRRGDSRIAHVTPEEESLLRTLGGAGTPHPRTGMPEFWGGEAGGFGPGGDPMGEGYGGGGGGYGGVGEGLGAEGGGWGPAGDPMSAGFEPGGPTYGGAMETSMAQAAHYDPAPDPTFGGAMEAAMGQAAQAPPSQAVGELGGILGAIGNVARSEPLSPANVMGLLGGLMPSGLSTVANLGARGFENLLSWSGIGPAMVEAGIVDRSGPVQEGNAGEDQNTDATNNQSQTSAATDPSLSTAQTAATPVFDVEAWLRTLPGVSGEAARRSWGLL